MRLPLIVLISIIFLGSGCEPLIGSASNAKFYNMGNVYFLANQLPEAIFAYRRGLP